MDDLPHARNDEDCPYSWLNEWLCEYVDGTMDPSLEAVFEEYIRANPELEAHIERLKRTQQLLEQCSNDPPPDAAPDKVCAQVQRRVESEMLRSTESMRGVVAKRPFAALVSSMAVALVIGLVAGATFLASPSTTNSASSAVASDALQTLERAAQSTQASRMIDVSRMLDQPAVAPLRSTDVNMSSYSARQETGTRLPPDLTPDTTLHSSSWTPASQP